MYIVQQNACVCTHAHIHTHTHTITITNGMWINKYVHVLFSQCCDIVNRTWSLFHSTYMYGHNYVVISILNNFRLYPTYSLCFHSPSITSISWFVISLPPSLPPSQSEPSGSWSRPGSSLTGSESDWSTQYHSLYHHQPQLSTMVSGGCVLSLFCTC